ncbi:unnamed protein product [Haemonchus placei]|uniref:G_PROTEIN_RECEP_F1_2 domain-containing protein n=1 Tax=Haemonchus placei TaxID=6290 RepID=A0A0N4WQF2_HAEPC|nr:unnamed protein product [Haemonchus placei]
MEDELLEFSGESPNHLDPVLMDTVLVNSDVSNFTGNTTLTLVQPATTMASLLPYLPNYYRIGTLAAKCILSLLLCVLSATIKRDFLKVFALMLIQFILLECVFDIYTEIQTSITHHGSSANSVFALISFIIADLIFWSTLFSSIVAFYYAHKAVVRPEEINYIPYANAFLRMQIFPILFTIIDTLVASYKVPPYVVLGSTVIIRLAACLVAVVLFTQALASVIVFCRRRDEYTKSSPYDQVRFIKSPISIDYIWAAVSLVQDFLITFNFSKEDEKSLPLEMAAELYVEHLRIFLIRPLVVLVAILVFIAPYRKKFIRFFCPCCRQ